MHRWLTRLLTLLLLTVTLAGAQPRALAQSPAFTTALQQISCHGAVGPRASSPYCQTSQTYLQSYLRLHQLKGEVSTYITDLTNLLQNPVQVHHPEKLCTTIESSYPLISDIQEEYENLKLYKNTQDPISQNGDQALRQAYARTLQENIQKQVEALNDQYQLYAPADAPPLTSLSQIFIPAYFEDLQISNQSISGFPLTPQQLYQKVIDNIYTQTLSETDNSEYYYLWKWWEDAPVSPLDDNYTADGLLSEVETIAQLANEIESLNTTYQSRCGRSRVPFVDDGDGILPGVEFGETQREGNESAGLAYVRDQLIPSLSSFLIHISFILATVMLVVVGYLFLFAGIDTEQASTAKKAILWIILGLTLAVLSYSLVRLVIGLNFYS